MPVYAPGAGPFNVFADWETYWTTDYSLSKMTTEAYILDKRFQIQALGVAINDGPVRIMLSMKEILHFMRTMPWDKCNWISHHTLFDGMIAAYYFDVNPDRWSDTMSMARPQLRHLTRSFSLDALCTVYDLPSKLFLNTRNRRIWELSQAELAHFVQYTEHDLVSLRKIYYELLSGLPDHEHDLIDLTIRMATEPQLDVDPVAASNLVLREKARKTQLMSKIGVTEEDLQSNNKFAMALQTLGVTPPMKMSLKTKSPAYAFARTDIEFRELLEHDDENVQALVAARLGVKSTMAERRAERIRDIGLLDWSVVSNNLRAELTGRKPFPVFLAYASAITMRYGGTNKINQTNLTRADKTKPVGERGLRDTVVAPPGKKLVVVDSMQIEARLLAWLAGETRLVEAFRQNRDVYSEFASSLYGHTIINTPEFELERFVGKVCILQLGYGSGSTKLDHSLRQKALDSKEPMRSKILKALDNGGAGHMVNHYRYREYTKIPDLWYKADEIVRMMVERVPRIVTMGPCQIICDQQIVIYPDGTYIRYNDLRRSVDQLEFVYTDKGITKKLYGGKFIENMCQKLARIPIVMAMIDLAKIGLRTALQVHDELLFAVLEHLAKAALVIAKTYLSRPMSWAPDLPLAASGGIGDVYSATK